MGTKKPTTTKTDAPEKRAATSLKTVKVATPAKPAAAKLVTAKPVASPPATPTPAPAKPVAAKPATKTKPATAPKRTAARKAKAPAHTHDDVALRAYFVSESRRNAGLPGDEHSDWLEAERQLKAEHSR